MNGRAIVLGADTRRVTVMVPLDRDDTGPALVLHVTEPPTHREDPKAHLRRQIQLQLRPGRRDRRRRLPDAETIGYVELSVNDHYEPK